MFLSSAVHVYIHVRFFFSDINILTFTYSSSRTRIILNGKSAALVSQGDGFESRLRLNFLKLSFSQLFWLHVHVQLQ